MSPVAFGLDVERDDRGGAGDEHQEESYPTNDGDRLSIYPAAHNFLVAADEHDHK